MDSSLLSILPQLGIGAIAVVGLVYVCKLFVDKMEKRDAAFSREFTERDAAFRVEIREREIAFRELEREIRGTLAGQLSKNTSVMERIMNHLDAPHRN